MSVVHNINIAQIGLASGSEIAQIGLASGSEIRTQWPTASKYSELEDSF